MTGKVEDVPLEEAMTSKGLCEEDVYDRSYHYYGSTYPERRFKEKVRHEPVYTFQTSKRLGRVIGSDECLKYRRR
jgi:hypothetical protein